MFGPMLKPRTFRAPKILALSLLIALGVRESPALAQAPADAPALVVGTGSSSAATPAPNDGSGSAVIQPGPSTSITSTTTTTPAGTTTQTTITVPDPTTDPMAFINAIRLLYSFGGWGLAAGGILVGLCYIATWLGKRSPDGFFGFFIKGRVAVAVGAIGSIVTTGIAAVTKTGGQFGWMAFLLALIGGGLAWWHPGVDEQAILDATARKVAAAKIAAATKAI